MLTGIVPWYKQEQSKRDGKPREGCDYSDMIAYGYCYDENDAVRYLKEKDQPRANVDAWLLMRLARMYQARYMDKKEADRYHRCTCNNRIRLRRRVQDIKVIMQKEKERHRFYI